MKRIIYLSTIILFGFSWACRPRSDEIRAPGLVKGDTVTIQALAGGTVGRVAVREGDVVSKGQLLAELNRDKIDNALKGLEIGKQELLNQEAQTREKSTFLRANVDYLTKQVQRFDRLNESESIPGDQLERAKLQLLEAKTSLANLQRTLENIEIQKARLNVNRENLELSAKDLVFLAPADGVVLDVYAVVGETALPGMVLLELLDPGSLYIETFIEETELSRLRLKDKVRIELDGRNRQDQFGTIRYFGRKAEFSPKYILSEKERQALLYLVRIGLESNRGLFKIGMPVTVAFQPAVAD